MKRILWVWLWGCLCLVRAMAQNVFDVRGRVIDRMSRQPVVGARVSPVAADTLFAVTDTA